MDAPGPSLFPHGKENPQNLLVQEATSLIERLRCVATQDGGEVVDQVPEGEVRNFSKSFSSFFSASSFVFADISRARRMRRPWVPGIKSARLDYRGKEKGGSAPMGRILHNSLIFNQISMVARGGIEPPTLCLEGRCSIRLSYRATKGTLVLFCLLFSSGSWGKIIISGGISSLGQV